MAIVVTWPSADPAETVKKLTSVIIVRRKIPSYPHSTPPQKKKLLNKQDTEKAQKEGDYSVPEKIEKLPSFYT